MELLLYGSMIFLAGIVFGCAFTKTICDLRRELDERIQKADISHLQDDSFLNQLGVFSRVFQRLENPAPTEKVDVEGLEEAWKELHDMIDRLEKLDGVFAWDGDNIKRFLERQRPIKLQSATKED